MYVGDAYFLVISDYAFGYIYLGQLSFTVNLAAVCDFTSLFEQIYRRIYFIAVG